MKRIAYEADAPSGNQAKTAGAGSADQATRCWPTRRGIGIAQAIAHRRKHA